MANISFAEALRKINRVEKALTNARARVEVSVYQRRLANMNQRIFVNGIATDEKLITSKVVAKNPREGIYSRRHGTKRKSTGRQTGIVDLNDTSNLRSSLIIGDSGGKKVLGFKDLKSRRIALSHEVYRKKEIWRGTKGERGQDKKVAIAEIRAIARRALR